MTQVLPPVKGLRGPTLEGLAHHAALLEAGKVLHVFIAHERDNQCDRCGLGRKAACHAVQRQLWEEP